MGVVASSSVYPFELFTSELVSKDSIKISIQLYSYGLDLLNGKMDVLDFPKIVREEFGLGGAEYWNIPFVSKIRDKKFIQYFIRSLTFNKP